MEFDQIPAQIASSVGVNRIILQQRIYSALSLAFFEDWRCNNRALGSNDTIFGDPADSDDSPFFYRTNSMPTARLPWQNVFSLIDPQINAEGVHVFPFDPACPIEVRFFQYDKRNHIRMNRHDYFELFYLQQGELTCRIQDHSSLMQSGDLAVISSAQYHTMQLPAHGSTSRPKAVTLYFMPELIRAADANGEGAEYLA